MIIAVLIGPCGIETMLGLDLTDVSHVLIGPCGIETYRNAGCTCM